MVTNDAGMKPRRRFPKPSETELRRRLSPIEYEVTQRAATEPAFQNRFLEQSSGRHLFDIVTGEPLFSSIDKFDSGNRVPSFFEAYRADRVIKKKK